MSAMHVVVRPVASHTLTPALEGLAPLIDVLRPPRSQPIDALTRRLEPSQGVSLLVDLAFALHGLFASQEKRITLPLHADSEVWELGLEADGQRCLASVFRQGPMPEVSVFERAIDCDELLQIALGCLTLADSASDPLLVSEAAALRDALQLLRELERDAAFPAPLSSTQRVTREIRAEFAGSRLSCQVPLRQSAASRTSTGRLERADLHGLLTTGTLRFEWGGQARELPSSQIFLDAERLLALAEEALESWRSLRPTFRRAQLSQGRLTLRRGPGEGAVELQLSGRSASEFEALVAELPAVDLVNLTARFCLELAHQTRRDDPSQRKNLRLTSISRAALHLIDQAASNESDETVNNPRPDTYRRFVPRVRRTPGMWEHGGKMRFAPRWVASVPAIDLSSTFLCGDQLIVGSVAEAACLDRRTGSVIWKQTLRPAACVVTPSGLVRVEPDGKLSCHHLDSGEVRFSLRVTPRAVGGAAGSVLYGPGLPKLLALSEGDRQVSGVDLVTGEVRWRYTARRPGAYRVRKAGKLLIVAGGDPLMVALDGGTGEVVWSLKSRMPFVGDVTVDHDSAFAVSGGAGSWTLHQFDPWSGKQGWQVELEERPVLGRAPLLTPKVVVVPTVDHDGSGALAFDRATGKPLWEHAPGLVGTTTAWLAVDDCILANSAQGVLIGLDAQSGHPRYNHVFAQERSADQPRRLEPILRSGALFIPQTQVHVVRPLDGELLATLPSDLIPDLMRVDERCDVYVAEESGHVAAFGAAPRLALVS